MDLKKQIEAQGGFTNLDFLAKQVVEGFISGMHKSCLLYTSPSPRDA